MFTEKAYENPFIQAVFKEIITDLKTIKFEVQKDGKPCKSVTSKFIEKTLKRPNKELSFSDFIESIATYIIFGGRCLLYKSDGILSRNIYVYAPDAFRIERNQITLEIEYIEIGDKIIKDEELEKYQIIKFFNPKDR
ncbi:MAG: hypothetical protein ACRCZ0_05705, partial [Cetobacterium sp.]